MAINTGPADAVGATLSKDSEEQGAISAAVQKKPRKARWGRRILLAFGFVALLVVALIAAAPSVVSSSTGTSYAVRAINDRVRGALEVDSLSASWTGPTEIRGLRVLDAQEREVLKIDRISHAAGLLGLIKSGLSFGEVVIDSPIANLYVNAANELSLANAFEMKNPSPPSPSDSLIPDLRGKLVIKNARIHAERESGEKLDANALNFDTTFDTLGDIGSKFALTLGDGSQISGDFAIKQLVTAGRMTPQSLAGTISFATSGAIDLGPLTRFLSPAAAVDGKLMLIVKATTDAGKVQADFTVDVAKLQTAQRAASSAAPIDLRVAGHAARDGDSINATANLSGEAGVMDTTLAWKLSNAAPSINAEQLLNAIFAGKSLKLPECSLIVKGAIDLAKLGKAVPGVLKLQPGKELTGGTLQIANLSVRGGDEPIASVAIELKGLTASSDGKTVQFQPITLGVDASLPAGKGLQLARADLKSSFADVSAKGTAADLQATLRGSFTRLQQELGQVFDLSAFKLGGDFVGDTKVACDGAGKPIVTSGLLTLSNLAYDGEPALDGDARVSWTNVQVLADGSKINADAARLESSAANVDAKSIRLQTSPALDMSADVTAAAELTRLFDAIGVFSGVDDLPDVAGNVTLTSHAATSGGKVEADFAIGVTKLQATDGTAAGGAPIDFRVAGKGSRDGDAIKATANLSGEAGVVDATVAYKLSDAGPKLDAGKLAGALFSGEALNLPDCALDVKGGVDLAKLGKAVPAWMKLQAGREITGGRLDITKLQAQGGANPTATVAIELRDLSAVSDGRPVQVQPIRLNLDASLPAGKGLQLAQADLKSSFIDVTAKGSASDLQATIRGSFARVKQELGQIFDLSGFKLGGDFSGDAKVACGGAGKPIVTTGLLVVSNLVYDGKSAVDGDAKLNWTNLQISPDGSRINADSAKLESSAANVDARAFKLQTSPALDMSADVAAAAELTRLFKAIGILSGMEKPPAIAGNLSLNSRVATTGKQVTFTGNGGVDNFVAGEGQDAVREKRVNLDFDGRIDQSQDMLSLAMAKLTSALLSVEASGTISQLQSSKNFALKGRYDASWREITTLLHELAPGTAGTVTVQGKSQGTFEITGPANVAGARPAFKGLTTAFDVGWDSANLCGAALSKAAFRPSLKDGIFTFPATTIPTASGTVHLGGMLDFTGVDPILRMPGTTRVLDKVGVTPQLAKSLLSRINPIFNKMVRVEGFVNMSTTDIAFPLGPNMKKSSAGKGFLDLGTLQVQPADFFAVLLDVLGYSTKDTELIEFSKLDFRVKNGRIEYDNFTMILREKVDLKFYGSVGFDDTLDLWVSVPLREALLKRIGIKEPALTYARKLTGLRIELPISGTRDNPKLDFSKIDVGRLVQEILLKGGAEKGLDDGIGGLLQGIGGDGANKQPEKPIKPEQKPRPRDRKKDRNKP